MDEKGPGGITTLMSVASMVDNSAEVLRLLANSKKGIDDQDKDGWTALHYAASRGFGRNVVMLLDAGAWPLCKNNDKETPRDLATKHGHVEAAVTLLEAERRAPLIKPEDLPEHVVNLEKIVEEQRAEIAALKAEMLAFKSALPKEPSPPATSSPPRAPAAGP